MREYIQSFDRTAVDLDNPEIYKYLPDTIRALDDRMLKDIGSTICYMDYWHPDVFGKKKIPADMTRDWTEEELARKLPDMVNNSGYYQRLRVYKLIENFCNERKNKWNDVMWFKEQVFLFEDEIENMC